ncbi:PE-PPE domain-containing protein [Mycobacterium pyrenivorans]|nr:PE-PPE domain-containing protein [Mycolicibacterium pyrenivorans]
MRRSSVSATVAILAIVVTMLLTVASVFTSALALAGTALIMGGSSHPLSVPQDTTEFITDYVDSADNVYIAPSGLCGATCSLIAVYTPEQFKFITGIFDLTFDESVAVGQANLNDCIRGDACTVTVSPYTETGPLTVSDGSYVVYAYSESSTIASKQKLQLIAHPAASTVSFMMLANPNRPNGGILERFVGAYIPFFGVTFNGATPTYSSQQAPLTTVDIARQYDGWTDFPTNPFNLLADINALMGTTFLHYDYFGAGTPQLQGQFQDTTYYLIPAPVVPLLIPLTYMPWVGRPLAIALDPAMRVLIETGYDRTINPGLPTPAKYFYIPNLIRAAFDFAVAIPTGWDDAISYITGDPADRPFHTQVPNSPFGVGGPPVYTGAVDPYGDPTPYVAPPVAAPVASITSDTETTSPNVAGPDAASPAPVSAAAPLDDASLSPTTPHEAEPDSADSLDANTPAFATSTTADATTLTSLALDDALQAERPDGDSMSRPNDHPEPKRPAESETTDSVVDSSASTSASDDDA